MEEQPQAKKQRLEVLDSTLPETGTSHESGTNFEQVPVPSNVDNASEENPTSPDEEPPAKKSRNTSTCAVADCPPNPPFPMHKFPDPSKDKARFTEWISFCKRNDSQFNPATAKICSLHFSGNCYQTGLVRKILKLDAVPDKNPPKNVSSSVKHHKAASRFNVQLQPKKRVLTATLSAPPSTKSIVEPILESIIESITTPTIWMDSGITTFEQRRSYEMKKMNTELQSPDVTPKPKKSVASETITPSPSTSEKR